jgi:outer membrane receptor protein involved in Fe transport
VNRQIQLFGHINNLFDREYSTAAQLGSTAFSGSGGFSARPFPAVGGEYPLVNSTFYAPGAPRTLWVGLRYSL